MAITTNPNLYACPNGRIPGIGSITAMDGSVWTVPAVVNYIDPDFPVASVLHNPCTGETHANAAEAIAVLDGSDIVEVDPGGELITAFIFADNYFEFYVNGVPIGKDDVPYTQFNSNIVRFLANRPFTLSMLLVDWEEHLGIGTEANGGFSQHPGDGGVVVVLKDGANTIIATTGSDWKAQTFYTAPVMDLTCPTETGAQRFSDDCSTADSNDGSAYYGLHWARPADWSNAGFDDTSWPAANTYSNGTVGVDNKPAYTNFTEIFDDPSDDAEFIWSNNLILDNEVIVRYTVEPASSVPNGNESTGTLRIFPNPAQYEFRIELGGAMKTSDIQDISIEDAFGRKVHCSPTSSGSVPLGEIAAGIYSVVVTLPNARLSRTLVVR